MTTALAPTTNGNGRIPARLDPYAGGLSTEVPRVDALAVISCGHRQEARGDRPGLPRASRATDPQQIHLHDAMGRAPGLAAALEAGQHRQLLIAFPLDDPAQFVIQRFTRYSASRLEAYGDETAITWIHPGTADTPARHQRFDAGTPEYERLVRTCKADTRIYFCLAEWTPTGPEITFPDGLGTYAIRTTSRHSVRSILGSLAYTSRFTRGKIAGLPFQLLVDYREVAGPDGAKRTIPVWTITTKPPEGARLSSRTFRDLAASALREGASLMLPAPTEPGWEDFDAEGPADVDEPSAAEIAQIAAGGLCDYEHWIRTWHALAHGTAFESDDARAGFLGAFTDGATTSLAEYFKDASEERATALIAALGAAVSKERTSAAARRYEEIFGNESSGTFYDLPNKATVTAAGRVVDTASGEVLAEPAGAQGWAENRRLVAEARKRGLTGLPPLGGAMSAPDVVAAANAELRERIQNFDLDAQLAREQEAHF